MLNIDQLRKLIIQPSLQAIGMYSIEAEQLLVGTALAESGLSFMAQSPTGPARSIWMIEQATYSTLRAGLYGNQGKAQQTLDFLSMDALPLNNEYLAGNLYAACIFARLKYATIKKPLPPINDAESMARYWAMYYNTRNLDSDAVRFMSLYIKYAMSPAFN